MLQRLRNNPYVRKLLTALTGSALSQFIPVLFSPLLTRLYHPDAFGVYTQFIAVTTVLATCASLSLDLAIATADDQSDAMSLLKAVFIQSTVIGLISTLVLFWGGFFTLLQPILGYVPFYILFFNLYTALNYLYVRFDRIDLATKIKMRMCGCVVFFNLLLGLIAPSNNGLAVSQVIGYFAMLCWELKSLSTVLNLRQLYAGTGWHMVWKKYKDYPLKFFPSNMMNVMALQIPAIMINSLFGATVGGFYSMTNRVLILPSAAIGNGIGDVYKTESFRELTEQKHYHTSTRKTLMLLIVIGILPYVMLLLWAPELFGFVFGKEWAVSGEMAQILSPMFLLKFIAVPIGFALVISKKSTQNLISQSLLLVATYLVFAVSGWLGFSWLVCFFVYGTVYMVYYLWTAVYSFFLSRQGGEQSDL